MSLRSESIPMDLTSFNAQNLGDAIYRVIKKFGFDIEEEDNENFDALERLQEFSEDIVEDIKRHNKDDAAIYEGKFNAAMATVEDQNNLGKWSGGHTRLTSVWQPRQYRQYNIK